MTDISYILEFLPCPTPEAWIDEACKPENLAVILVDHANNELKAAQSAMAIMSRYRSGTYGRNRAGSHSDDAFDEEKVGLQLKTEDQLSLLNKMSRLAREELRHFEQVLAIMARRNIPYDHLGAGRYAGRLSTAIRTFEPYRLVDTLIMGAFIEARSCERFTALAPWLDDELKTFYQSLLRSESRHFQDYLALAEAINGASVADRVTVFGEIEQNAIESPDQVLRFHSGVPDFSLDQS
ncbi:tRNA-(ms[2]io[6]A)-hydroxylase [Endozoicomonas sp. SCSIO W0465]|uniref:tRNA-(ms[2]io[6]A)-hydroxylase n=1 Tax=Endozoicomonas sp. SCSIO W0465 TaxID=2918516 RepID=UPI0020764113|nr:tRNA isopentenyl-2-thiomethyl-A-37 hydroxylase MiaE [Endozoicomonas sp. SCSIO W0465]USE33945.1 tRNA isopentenyl-2-thiomethyl-A-37 hydroxylase MiaE [Endozoicomonas sp. SCSIO W0465]